MLGLNESTRFLCAEHSLAAQVLDLIQTEGLRAVHQLPAQWLANRLRVSHSPVNEAFALLAERSGLAMRNTASNTWIC